jgi:peptidyl-tRNA hydrolase, PTH1 family
VKYLIIGLGNIGDEYAGTRHNIGFQVVERLATSETAIFKSDRYAFVTQIKYKGRILVLCKPTTYMNLSGKAVNYWLQKENVPIENLLIVVDDLALPYGSIRIKKKGSDAGHNGLIDIIQTLGHNEFNRMRFGIGNEFSKGSQIDYVLGEWTSDELKSLPERLDKMSEAIKSFVTIGIDRTMNYFNGK